MKLHLDADPQNFLSNVSPALECDASVNSFILSLTSRYVQIQKPMPILARGVSIDGSIVAAGVQTESDRVLIISKIFEPDAEEFAELLSRKLDKLPGVNGPAPGVDAFAKKWTMLKGNSATISTNLRLFELTTIINRTHFPNGIARIARFGDRDIIFEWMRAFHKEAVPHDPKATDDDLYKSIDTGIVDEQYFVWEDDGKVVCLVGSRRETLTERWIAPVYTPPEIRGRGYGSALTAFVSERILASGKKGMLFTDLANPTSNSIYQKIGYKPVADFKHYSFS